MLTDEFNKRAGKNYFYRETLRQNDQSRFKALTTLYQLVYLRNQERKFSCFLFCLMKTKKANWKKLYILPCSPFWIIFDSTFYKQCTLPYTFFVARLKKLAAQLVKFFCSSLTEIDSQLDFTNFETCQCATCVTREPSHVSAMNASRECNWFSGRSLHEFCTSSLRTANTFPVAASLPAAGNASAIRRLQHEKHSLLKFYD